MVVCLIQLTKRTFNLKSRVLHIVENGGVGCRLGREKRPCLQVFDRLNTVKPLGVEHAGN